MLSTNLICQSIQLVIQKKEIKAVIIYFMGGNAFEDTEKLTPEEYTKVTNQIYELISPICHKIEPYIPLPQKEVHGDVDFLIVLKEGYTLQSIMDLLQLKKEHYILNNNQTANTVYHKKQIDFNAAADEAEFYRCRFYKSYGGLGAFLGLMLPSKFVKFNEDGLFCLCYHQHIKMEFKVTQNIDEILIFYGLQPQVYHKGFTNRRSLFQFMIATKFLDPKEFVTRELKCTTKLIASFQKYLDENRQKIHKQQQRVQDPISFTLNYFNKRAQYDQAWKQKTDKEAAKKQRTSKWNGLHIMKVFGVTSKQVNSLKKRFEGSFTSREQYQKFIDESEFEEIIRAFAKICELKLG